MLISANSNAGHRSCTHRNLFTVYVKAVFVLREDHGKAWRALLQRLHINIDWLVEGPPAMDRMCRLRPCICIVLICTNLIRPRLDQIGEHHLWIGIPVWTRIDAKRTQGAMRATWWAGDDSFNPASGRQQYVIGGHRRVLTIVKGEGDSRK